MREWHPLLESGIRGITRTRQEKNKINRTLKKLSGSPHLLDCLIHPSCVLLLLFSRNSRNSRPNKELRDFPFSIARAGAPVRINSHNCLSYVTYGTEEFLTEIEVAGLRAVDILVKRCNFCKSVIL